MTKGGGRPKGRPKKVVDLTTQAKPVYTLNPPEDAGCSSAAGMKNTTDEKFHKPMTVESIKQQIKLEIQASVLKQQEDIQIEGKKRSGSAES